MFQVDDASEHSHLGSQLDSESLNFCSKIEAAMRIFLVMASDGYLFFIVTLGAYLSQIAE